MQLNPGRRDSRLGSNHLPRAGMFNAFGVRTGTFVPINFSRNKF